MTVSTAAAFRAAAGGKAGGDPRGWQHRPDDQVRVAFRQDNQRRRRRVRFTGAGLDLTDSENVIIQNLIIAKAVGADAITVQRSRHVLIDTATLGSDRDQPQGYYDGLVDITHASNGVAVVARVIADHYDTGLVGHSDDNAARTPAPRPSPSTTTSTPASRPARARPLRKRARLRTTCSPTSPFTRWRRSWAQRSSSSRTGRPVRRCRSSPRTRTPPRAPPTRSEATRNSGSSEITMDTSWTPPYTYDPTRPRTRRPWSRPAPPASGNIRSFQRSRLSTSQVIPVRSALPACWKTAKRSRGVSVVQASPESRAVAPPVASAWACSDQAASARSGRVEALQYARHAGEPTRRDQRREDFFGILRAFRAPRGCGCDSSRATNPVARSRAAARAPSASVRRPPRNTGWLSSRASSRAAVRSSGLSS